MCISLILNWFYWNGLESRWVWWVPWNCSTSTTTSSSWTMSDPHVSQRPAEVHHVDDCGVPRTKEEKRPKQVGNHMKTHKSHQKSSRFHRFSTSLDWKMMSMMSIYAYLWLYSLYVRRRSWRSWSTPTPLRALLKSSAWRALAPGAPSPRSCWTAPWQRRDV